MRLALTIPLALASIAALFVAGSASARPADCTAGMTMSALALLTSEPEPTREDIARGMSGNICRCCTYARIMTAVEQAARAMKGGAR